MTTLDVAKAMIDEGYHPMTMYFPLVVHGAMLIEPTESESKASLDLFIATLRDLAMAREARRDGALHRRALPRPAPPPRRDPRGAQPGAEMDAARAGGGSGGVSEQPSPVKRERVPAPAGRERGSASRARSTPIILRLSAKISAVVRGERRLSRPSLTRGPPSPAEGRGFKRGSCPAPCSCKSAILSMTTGAPACRSFSACSGPQCPPPVKPMTRMPAARAA